MIEQTKTRAEVIRGRYDVCVVGGGMAGLCAALAAARNGAKTVLVQDRPVLGGNASSEVRMWVCGAHGENLKETGLLEEVQLDNAYRNPTGHYSIWDSVLWAKATYQPNLTLLLNTACTGCEASGPADDRRLSMIRCWQLTSQSWHEIEADIFIDCSGDSILALSGARFRFGREARAAFGEDIEPTQADHRTMGNSLLIQIRRTDEPQPFIAPDWAYKFESPEDLPYRINGVRGHNFWWLELGGIDDTIADAEKIRDELMRAAWGVWDYIKNRAPQKDEAEHWALEWLGSYPGKRENRRYVGHHIMTQHDVRDGGRFDDVIAYGGWTMDDHHPAGLLYPGKPTVFHPAPSPYGIPYRSLVSINVRNLMMAGRNISVTHAALSSTRVMATCALLGQAAGTAAAIAVRKGIAPATLHPDHMDELQRTLMEDDAYLPGLARPTDSLAQAADYGEFAELRSGHDRPIGERDHAVEVEPGTPIELRFDQARRVGGLRLVFDSNLNADKRMPCSYPLKADRSLVPKTLIKAYRVEAQQPDGTWRTVDRQENNYQRLVHAPVQAEARALRFVPEQTWGGDRARLFALEPTARFAEKRPTPPSGPAWSQVVARQEPADLAPPEHGLEAAQAKAPAGHSA